MSEIFKVGDMVECIATMEHLYKACIMSEASTISEVGCNEFKLEEGYKDYWYQAKDFKLTGRTKQTNKPIKEESNMSEATVTIGSIFLEVFENGKDAKRMSDRFGEQYGENPDRDLIALENDKGKLTRILEDEEGKEEAAAEKAAKGGK